MKGGNENSNIHSNNIHSNENTGIGIGIGGASGLSVLAASNTDFTFASNALGQTDDSSGLADDSFLSASSEGFSEISGVDADGLQIGSSDEDN
jgi:hypothetical protein